jgi:hypothetical protein
MIHMENWSLSEIHVCVCKQSTFHELLNDIVNYEWSLNGPFEFYVCHILGNSKDFW